MRFDYLASMKGETKITDPAVPPKRNLTPFGICAVSPVITLKKKENQEPKKIKRNTSRIGNVQFLAVKVVNK